MKDEKSGEKVQTGERSRGDICRGMYGDGDGKWRKVEVLKQVGEGRSIKGGVFPRVWQVTRRN